MDHKRECVILAGGFGTRLRGVVRDLPKPMAPIEGKPFLWYLMKWLEKYRPDKIVISAGYKSQSILDYFGDSFSGIPLIYAIEKKPLGTGGAVKYAIGKTAGTDILVLNGDTYFPVDIEKLWNLHTSKNYIFTIALKKMKNFSRYGTVKTEGDTIVSFLEKKYCSEGFINGGIYLINRNFFESLKMPEIFSLENDILMKKVSEGIFKGLEFDDTFIDIGIPEDYSRAKLLLGNID